MWTDPEADHSPVQRQIPATALAPQIARRLSAPQMAAYLRILAHVAGGRFSNFDDVPHPNSLSEYEIVVSGLDFENAGTYEKETPGKSKPKPDEVFGQHMNFIQVLPGVLHVMAQTLRRHTLSDALKLPLEELLAARDDVCSALAISRDLLRSDKMDIRQPSFWNETRCVVVKLGGLAEGYGRFGLRSSEAVEISFLIIR
jgi:hypothetical protein